MTKKKHPEVKREIQNPTGYPSGTVIEEFMDGSMTIHNPDGTQEFIDAQGKALAKLTITETQIEAWKKMPKEEGTKRILELINNNTLDVSEKRFILDAIWKLVELHGATISPHIGAQIVAIRINVQGTSEKVKDIEAKVISNAKETITLSS